MDEDQEYERLDMDNDYEGGEWIEDEFYYRNKKRKRMQSRDDQIYGVFGDGDGGSDSDNDNRRDGLGGKRKDYTKPVGFVGGGVMGGNKGLGLDDNDAAEEAEMRRMVEEEAAGEDEEEDYGTGGGRMGLGGGVIGLGFSNAGLGSSGGGGLGFSSSGGRGGIGLGAAVNDEAEEQDAGGAEDFLPTAFGRRIKAAAEARRKQQAEESKKQKTGAGGRGGIGSGSSARPAGDVGAFEVHTKGIGSKLLSKMGWKEGEGLGKDRKGISKPLEAKLRPKGMGMGYGDRREPKLAPEEPEKEVLKKEKKAAAGKKVEVVDIRAEAAMWKRKSSPMRVKRSFKTADELLQEEEEGAAIAVQKRPSTVVVDMRGPQTRVLTNLDDINVDAGDMEAGGGGEDGVPMPELRHNMRLLVELAEADIQLVDGKLRQQKDTKLILEREKERLAEEAKDAADAAARVAAVLQGLELARTHQSISGNDNQSETVDAVRNAFSDLRSKYPEEYQLYNIATAALGCALPALSAALSGWSPLADPAPAAELFASWRPLLEREAHRHVSLPSADVLTLAASTDPYLRLICEIVLPPLRRDLIGGWDPRDAVSFERFLESWDRILPVPALDYVMVHLVLPRLKSAVDAWDPTSDPIAPHTWIHPWLPYLGAQLSEVWPMVRFKFGTALQQWHPADASAHALLEPWKRVFNPKEWEVLLNRAVVPKLEDAMADFVVNPASQDLEPFLWLMDWADLMSQSQMSRLLTTRFFPKWHAALRHWLSTDSPNLDDVTRWYLQWKALFPASVLEAKAVKSAMNAALDAINTAGRGGPLPTTWTAPPPIAIGGNGGVAAGATTANAGDGTSPRHPSYEDAYGSRHNAHPTVQDAGTTASLFEERPLRSLVEDYANDNEIDFLPKSGRFHEGLQVYGFGLVSCAIDSARQRLWAQMGGTDGKSWVAASMSQLLEEHQRRQAAKDKKGFGKV